MQVYFGHASAHLRIIYAAILDFAPVKGWDEKQFTKGVHVGVRSRKYELGRGEKDKKQCYSPGHGVQHAINQKATTRLHLIKYMYSWKLRKT